MTLHHRSRRPRSSPPERSTARVLLSGGMWNNLSSAVPIVANIILTPYVIHGFGIARWGLFVLVTTISVFLGPLNAGLGGTVGRYFAVYAGRDDREKTTETLLTMLCVLSVLGGVGTAIGWVLSPVVIHLFGVRGALTEEGIFLLRALGALVTITFLHNLFGAVINARQRWALTNLTGTAIYGVWVVGLVACVHYHLGLRGVAGVFLAQQVLATVVIVPTSLQYLTRRAIRFLSWTEVKELVRYAGSIQAMGIISLVNNEVDSLLIGGLFNVRTLAFYNSGSGFAGQLRGLPLNLLGPAGTHLARVFGRDGDDAAVDSFGQLQRLWVIGATGFSMVGLGSAYFAVTAWLGSEFSLAGQVAVVLMVGNTINLWTGVLTQYIAAVGRPDLEMRYAFLAMSINIALTVPLAFTGALGVSAATVVGSVVASLYLVRIVHRRYRSDLPHFLRDVPIVPGVIAAMVTAGLELLIRPDVPTGPIGLLCCGVPGLIGLVIFTVSVLGRDCRAVLSMARRRDFALRPIVDLLLRDGPPLVRTG